MKAPISNRDMFKDDEDILSNTLKSNDYATHALILIPGIRDWGNWNNTLNELLTDNYTIKVILVRPGEWIDLITFLIPFFHPRIAKSVGRKITDIYNSNYHTISFISHSFGTYCLHQFIKNNPDKKIDKIILCGAIAKDDDTWNTCNSNINYSKRSIIINDCGLKDYWPIVAKWIFPTRFGSIGRVGLSSVKATNRYFHIGHGGFFSKSFINKYWLPFIVEDKIVSNTPIENTSIPKIATLFTIKYFSLPAMSIYALLYYFFK